MGRRMIWSIAPVVMRKIVSAVIMMKLAGWGIIAHMEFPVPYSESSFFAAKSITKSLPCFMEAILSRLYFMMTVKPTSRGYSIQT